MIAKKELISSKSESRPRVEITYGLELAARFNKSEIYRDIVVLLDAYDSIDFERTKKIELLFGPSFVYKNFCLALESYLKVYTRINSGDRISDSEIFAALSQSYKYCRSADLELNIVISEGLLVKNSAELAKRSLQNIPYSIYNELMFYSSNKLGKPKKSISNLIIETISEIKIKIDQLDSDEKSRDELLSAIINECYNRLSSSSLNKCILHRNEPAGREIAAKYATPKSINPPAYPTSPPDGKLYENRNEAESAPEFIKNVYGRWLTGEFTRADLRKIDFKAEMALRNWERSHGRAPLNLPTKKERNDRLLAQAGSEEKPEAAKLHDALRARKRRERTKTP